LNSGKTRERDTVISVCHAIWFVENWRERRTAESASGKAEARW